MCVVLIEASQTPEALFVKGQLDRQKAQLDRLSSGSALNWSDHGYTDKDQRVYASRKVNAEITKLPIRPALIWNTLQLMHDDSVYKQVNHSRGNCVTDMVFHSAGVQLTS